VGPYNSRLGPGQKFVWDYLLRKTFSINTITRENIEIYTQWGRDLLTPPLKPLRVS